MPVPPVPSQVVSPYQRSGDLVTHSSLKEEFDMVPLPQSPKPTTKLELKIEASQNKISALELELEVIENNLI